MAAFLTAALSLWFERIAYVWYPMLAVITVMEDGDDLSLRAGRVRVFGTITGGLVTFVVHTVLDGWTGVLVSMLLILPLLRWLGWQSAAGTATLVSIMFLMIPSHVALDWSYVFNRTLDTAVGCVIAILVGLLFWPRRGFDRLMRLEAGLRSTYTQQLERQRGWLDGRQERPHRCCQAASAETWWPWKDWWPRSAGALMAVACCGSAGPRGCSSGPRCSTTGCSGSGCWPA